MRSPPQVYSARPERVCTLLPETPASQAPEARDGGRAGERPATRRARLLARVGVPLALVDPLLFIGGAVGLYGLGLKLQRVLVYPSRIRPDVRLALLGPDLAFAIGFSAVLFALFLLFARARLPRVGLVLAQLLGLAAIALTTLAHGYFLASGQTLDYGMFAFALTRASETAGVVASEAHLPLTMSASIFTLIVLVWPWYALRVTSREHGASARQLHPDASPRASYASFMLAWVVAFISVFVGTLAPRRIDRSFARDPVTHIAAGALAAARQKESYRGTFTRLRKTGPTRIVARDPAAKPKNLVVILLESTRADATTPYTPELETTPFLARFAGESVRVDRGYTVVPHTSKALVAIFCGFEPEVNLNLIEAEPDGLPGSCLPRLLAQAGYDTAFFQAPTGRFEKRSTLVKNLGFRHFRSGDEVRRTKLQRINYFGYEDAIMLSPSKTWLERRREKPFLAAYLTNASHHPYGVPTTHQTKRFHQDFIQNKYLNAVPYVEGVVEQMVDQYKSAGLYDETVFLVVGDHGEAFGEHGLLVHDDVMYEEVLHVPMLLRLPRAERARERIPGPVSELSLAPTLLDVLGFDYGKTGEHYEGESWFTRPREPVLFASCYRGERCAALIRHPHKLIYGFDERPAELYDLARDPKEEVDLAEDEPELALRYAREIHDLRLSIHETYKQASARALRAYVTAEPPHVETRLSARFGSYLELLGYNMPAEALRTFGSQAINRFEMSYYFRVHEPVPPGYELRVVMRGERESKTMEHVPVRGLYALSDWKRGEYIDDVHRLVLPDRWGSSTVTPCLMLVDERGVPVPALQPGEKAAACVPIATLTVHKRRGR